MSFRLIIVAMNQADGETDTLRIERGRAQEVIKMFNHDYEAMARSLSVVRTN